VTLGVDRAAHAQLVVWFLRARSPRPRPAASSAGTAEAAGTGGAGGGHGGRGRTRPGSPPGQVTAALATDPTPPLAAKGGPQPAGAAPASSPVLAGGGDVAAQGQECRRPIHGAPAPGDLLLHPPSTPAASIATLPRLACTVSSVSRPVEAEWTQCSRPATLAPVSSKWATGAVASRSRTTSMNPPSAAAPSATTAARVPLASGAPSTSASSCAARSTGRCWCTHG
jgi:hypothetical protein